MGKKEQKKGEEGGKSREEKGKIKQGNVKKKRKT